MKNTPKHHSLRCLAVAVTMLYMLPSQAQSIIYDNLLYSELSIIRNYKKYVDITYSAIGGDPMTFNYINRDSLIMRKVDINQPFYVKDFVIYDGYVYFCGASSVPGNVGGLMATYGYFNIDDVFFHNGSITYGLLPMQDSSISPGYNKVAELNKIDVMRTALGETHLLMIGYGIRVRNAKQDTCRYTYYPGAIVDVMINTLGTHIINYYVDEGYTYSYADVTIADTFAVVAGSNITDNPPRQQELFFYRNPTNLGESYFDPCITPPNIANVPMMESDQNELPVNGEVRVTKMGNNMFTTVCGKYVANNADKLAVSIYQGMQTQPIYRYELPWDDYYAREIVYNTLQEKLYILPGNYYAIYALPYPFNTTDNFFTISNYRWTSIDNTDNDEYEILSGYEYYTYYKKLWRYGDQGHSQCVVLNSRQNMELPTDDDLKNQLQKILEGTVTLRSFNVKAITYKFSIECTEQ